MKLPGRKREELMDKFLTVASNAVRQLDNPQSVSQTVSTLVPSLQAVQQVHHVPVQQSSSYSQMQNYNPRPAQPAVQQQFRPVSYAIVTADDPSQRQQVPLNVNVNPISSDDEALVSFARALPSFPNTPLSTDATASASTSTTSAAPAPTESADSLNLGMF